MKRIIIFRFHKNSKVCLNRLQLLHKQNPNILIYGIYGGRKESYPIFKKNLKDHLVNIYPISNKSINQKRQNFDLILRLRYRKIGKNISFDMAYIIERDLILNKSIAETYKHIKKNQIGITGLTKLKNISTRWRWTSKEPHKTQWNKLLQYVSKKYSYKQQPYASLGPGLCLPKSFLEKYTNTYIPTLCHDEIRIPLFAQIFNIKLIDTWFYNSRFDPKEEKYFNCDNKEIPLKTIIHTKNRSAFHPYRKNIPITNTIKTA